MTRKIKALGLALVAVFALSALAASGAQAANHHLTVPNSPAIITAEDHVNNVFSITGGEHSVECTTENFEGTVKEKTNTEITVTPTRSGCKIDPPFGPTATTDLNHCAYILTGETDVSGDAKVHLECAEGNEITVTYSLFGSQCVMHMPAQTPSGGVHYTQTTNPTTAKKDITINVTLSGITYKETGGGFCPATHEGTDGTVNGAVTVQAYKHEIVNCNELAGTGSEAVQGRTTPGNYYNECEGAVQDLELTTT